MSDELLTTRQATLLLHIHRTTLDRWVREGRLPVIQPVRRGQRRFRRADIDALLTPQTRTAP